MASLVALKSVTRWLSVTIGASLLVTVSVGFLLSGVPTLVIAEAEQLPLRKVPSYLASIAPIASGSVSAITPLPRTNSPLAADLATVSDTDPAAAPSGDYWRVTASGLNVRSDASSGSSRIGTLQGGERVLLEGQNGKWALVRSDSGLRGWVFARYLANTPALTE